MSGRGRRGRKSKRRRGKGEIGDIKICHGTHGMEKGGRNGKLEAFHHQLRGRKGAFVPRERGLCVTAINGMQQCSKAGCVCIWVSGLGLFGFRRIWQWKRRLKERGSEQKSPNLESCEVAMIFAPGWWRVDTTEEGEVFSALVGSSFTIFRPRMLCFSQREL